MSVCAGLLPVLSIGGGQASNHEATKAGPCLYASGLVRAGGFS